MNRLRVIVITGAFPALSETFILNQITRLIDLKHEILILPVSPQEGTQVQEDVVKYDLLSKTQYPSLMPASKWLQRGKSISSWVRFFIRSPIVALKIIKANLNCKRGFSHKRLLLSIQLFQKPFDVVHCHFGPNAEDIVELKNTGLRIPLVTSFHGYDINSYPLAMGKNCYGNLFSIGEVFTANTNYTKQRMVEHGCDPLKIHIVHESLRCEKFYVPIKARSNSSNVTNILTVGRMVEKKGYEYSLKAVEKVIARGFFVEYWIVGDGPLRSQLEILIQELKISSHVKMFGALTESKVLSLYRQADLFMLPSVTASNGDKEGQGLVLQEAQMAGLPVISTLHNGIPDGVLDCESGFLVPEKDVDALVEKIEYLIRHPEIRKKMGEAGQVFVQKTFDVSCVVDSLLNTYGELRSTNSKNNK